MGIIGEVRFDKISNIDIFNFIALAINVVNIDQHRIVVFSEGG